MKTTPSLAAVGGGVLALALLSVQPAAAQTGSLWHDQKINDMKAHERDSAFDSRANEHFQMGLRYMSEMQRILRDDERGPRTEKKLGKAYKKAVGNFESAIDVEPEWIDAHIMLGSVHYKMKDYDAAKAAYQAALAIDPEHADARAYLSTVEWYLEHPEATEGS